MSTIDAIQEAVAKVASEASGSVVGVGQRWALGSGVVVGDGRVLTNAHNVRRGEVTVSFADGRRATGRPLGVDVDGDLAVLEVDTAGCAPLEWASDATPDIGAPVFGISNPGGRGLRVTFGLVSGTQRSFRGPRGRRISGSVEHTAPLLPGSSGGPIVDREGRLLGINTNRLGEGFYLAIPADDELKQKVESLAKGEAPRRVRLGVGVAPSHVARGLRRAVGLPEVDGLLVRQVEEGSPAAAAGIEEGDLITRIGDRAITDFDSLVEAIDPLAAGQSVDVTLVRGTDERVVSVEATTS